MKKIIFILMFAVVFSGVLLTPAFSASSPPDLVSEAAILIDATTGVVLYEKNIDMLFEPASTTKIMTCLLTLENFPLSRIITVDAVSPFTGGSRIYIAEGEELTVEQLLYATMLYSANDTSAALAIAISGSVEEFAVLMNEKASQLGAKNPSYKNPHGLHEAGHLASAYDLAMVAREAMKNPIFRQIVSTKQYTIPETNKQEERAYIYTTNLLLYDAETKVPVKGVMTPAKYEGAIGIKTGYTPQAGASLVAAALRDGTELISVVLKTTEVDRFGDTIALFDYGFENYYTYKAVDSSLQIDDAKVRNGSVNRVSVAMAGDSYITLPKEASVSLVATKIVMDEKIIAPISEGQQLGIVEVYEGDKIIDEIAILATSSVPEGRFLSRFGIEDKTSSVIMTCALILLVILVLVCLTYGFLVVRYALIRRSNRAKRAREIANERERKKQDQNQRRWPY